MIFYNCDRESGGENLNEGEIHSCVALDLRLFIPIHIHCDFECSRQRDDGGTARAPQVRSMEEGGVLLWRGETPENRDFRS